MRELWRRVRWDVRRLYHQLRKAVLLRRIGDRWENAGGVERRKYPDYETYVEHQKTKLDAFRFTSIRGHDRRFRRTGAVEPGSQRVEDAGPHGSHEGGHGQGIEAKPLAHGRQQRGLQDDGSDGRQRSPG